jgi:hypothetical protein
METTLELDLGTQRIKKMGSYHYFGIPKQLIDSGAIPLDVDYHIKVIVSKKEITIEKKNPEVPA